VPVARNAEDKVMRLVEDLLQKTPDMPVGQLYEHAKKASAKIGELNMRQFNARYPLQIKLRQARSKDTAARGGRPRAQPAARRRRARSGNRDQVREILLGFAVALAGAEDKKDLVKVLAGVDEVVDRVVKAAGGR
jgi:hypothetical protein